MISEERLATVVNFDEYTYKVRIRPHLVCRSSGVAFELRDELVARGLLLGLDEVVLHKICSHFGLIPSGPDVVGCIVHGTGEVVLLRSEQGLNMTSDIVPGPSEHCQQRYRTPIWRRRWHQQKQQRRPKRRSCWLGWRRTRQWR